ncbi:MAG: SIMPL domain-containing protein [Spirochaetaceae bacterium]|jgi:uncharacterized protein YggE|nr:SIMPL domain-containing protein [Spirochaetaceae bacterium]
MIKKISAALFVAVLVLACAKESNQSTVSVIGIGTVSAQPDVVQINVSISQVSPTTRQAQEAVNTRVAQVLEILKSESIDDKNISTPSLQFTQEYEWRANSRVLVGQKVEQAINFLVKGIQSDTEKVSRILDRMTEIESVALNQINFSVEDNQELFVKSRELAYQKALEKAAQYAELSGLKIIRALSIAESGSANILPVKGPAMMQKALYSNAEVAGRQSDTTILPTGEIEITTQISAVFLLK